ncbi:MAG: hypothetical protein QXI19_07740, partial [Candidatus Caldarchaeum sp.]
NSDLPGLYPSWVWRLFRALPAFIVYRFTKPPFAGESFEYETEVEMFEGIKDLAALGLRVPLSLLLTAETECSRAQQCCACGHWFTPEELTSDKMCAVCSRILNTPEQQC